MIIQLKEKIIEGKDNPIKHNLASQNDKITDMNKIIENVNNEFEKLQSAFFGYKQTVKDTFYSCENKSNPEIVNEASRIGFTIGLLLSNFIMIMLPKGFTDDEKTLNNELEFKGGLKFNDIMINTLMFMNFMQQQWKYFEKNIIDVLSLDYAQKIKNEIYRFEGLEYEFKKEFTDDIITAYQIREKLYSAKLSPNEYYSYTIIAVSRVTLMYIAETILIISTEASDFDIPMKEFIRNITFEHFYGNINTMIDLMSRVYSLNN